MRIADWIIFFGFLAYVVWDGIRRGRGTRSGDDYFLAGRSIPWWGVGLSIMATQASAITMIGTSGQGWLDGLRFVQFYFALPLAMLVLAVTLVPAYHRSRVTTAYEFLGLRFDGKTRTLSAALFLFLRGLSVGFVIYAPSLVLSKVFSLPFEAMVVAMGVIAVTYTAIGGLGAVIATDVKQMTVMVLGLLVAIVTLVRSLPADIGLSGAWHLADAVGHLKVVDWRWDPTEKYTVWSSLIGGLFLFLSYFGTDQSQAQRLLASRSLSDTRRALFLNAVAKVPFQFAVLGVGVLLLAFYATGPAPISFDPNASREAATLTGAEAARYQAIEARHAAEHAAVEAAARSLAESPDPSRAGAFKDALAAERTSRNEARELRGGIADTHYVFLDFILSTLPVGLAGLLLAAIFAAALSSVDSELNAMSTVAVHDIVVPLKGGMSESGIVATSRIATFAVGAFATAFALYAGDVGSLIEAVNRVGSYVYGSLLGAFVLALAVPWATGTGAFVGLVAGMVVVGVAAQTDLAFLFLNTVGTLSVVGVGAGVSLLDPARKGGRNGEKGEPGPGSGGEEGRSGQ